MSGEEAKRRYSVGYVSGSFDLFHIGHLNLIRRAKELCDYLIAGVLTDELIAAMKGKWPVVPLAERMDIVGALRFVDRVDATTPELIPKTAAWEKYHFDAIFSGDDHVNDGWAHDRKALKALGAEMVFFPYTKEVSTTVLQDIILPPAAETKEAEKIGEFRYLFPFNKVNKGEKIVIYGKGEVGGQYLRQVQALDFCEIAAITDTYAKDCGDETFEGVPVVVPEKLSEYSFYDRVVVASASHHRAIIGKLRVLGIPAERIV